MQNPKCVPLMARRTAIAASLLITMPVMAQQLMLEEVIVTA